MRSQTTHADVCLATHQLDEGCRSSNGSFLNLPVCFPSCGSTRALQKQGRLRKRWALPHPIIASRSSGYAVQTPRSKPVSARQPPGRAVAPPVLREPLLLRVPLSAAGLLRLPGAALPLDGVRRAPWGVGAARAARRAARAARRAAQAAGGESMRACRRASHWSWRGAE